MLQVNYSQTSLPKVVSAASKVVDSLFIVALSFFVFGPILSI